jgi:hypothetical protein
MADSIYDGSWPSARGGLALARCTCGDVVLYGRRRVEGQAHGAEGAWEVTQLGSERH